MGRGVTTWPMIKEGSSRCNQLFVTAQTPGYLNQMSGPDSDGDFFSDRVFRLGRPIHNSRWSFTDGGIRNLDNIRVPFELKRDVGVHAGIKFMARVLEIDLSEHRPRREIE